MSYLIQDDTETIRWTFDFTGILITGDTLTGAPTVTATDGATVGSVTSDTTSVSVEISGVAFRKVARVKCTSATVSGETLSKEAVLRGGAR